MNEHGKHTAKYWETRVNERPGIAGLQVRIGFGGVEHWFKLNTNERGVAATKARDIWMSLQTVGLQETLVKFKPSAAMLSAKPSEVTLGEWLDAVRPILMNERTHGTVAMYEYGVRRVARGVMGIDETKLHWSPNNADKEAWKSASDAIKLAEFTSERISEWLWDQLNTLKSNPKAFASRQRTYRNYVRSIKVVFSEGIIKQVKSLTPPSPLPSADLPHFKFGSTKYVSNINAQLLLQCAHSELSETDPEAYKAFLLALCCGFRRHEIDLMEWAMFDWEKNVISLCETEILGLKTEGSIASGDVDPEIMAVLKTYFGKSTTKFVITSNREYKTGGSRQFYRCQKIFNRLISWLRSKGVTARKPIHELRKELGALTANKYGIFAAAATLRHSNIKTTAMFYVDKKQTFSVGLGKSLFPGLAVEEPKQTTQNP